MSTPDLGPRALLGALVVALLAAGCRKPEAAPPAAPPAASPSERGLLLERIMGLDEVAPCFGDAGAARVRLVDAELAGDAATATFACENGAASGKVTFFRVAGAWTISTKEIRAAARGAQPAGRSTTPEPAPGSRTSVAPSAR
jgi:hypothetical protein